jgi:hypothetical protein
MVNLPELMKPATYTEEMTECRCKVPRGRMEWRVRRGLRTNMGDPNISWQTSGMMRESEMPILVKIVGTT